MRDVIVAAAKAVFLREGHQASIEAIITEAGIARQSLYNHFSSKKVLLKEVIEEFASLTMKPLLDLELSDDLELPEALHLFGTRYMEGTLQPESLAMTRLISSATIDYPDLGPIVYKAGPQRWIPRLTAYLRNQARAGKIRCAAPTTIAESFCGALVGVPRFRYLMNVNVNTTPAQRRAYVSEIVAFFVNGLGYDRSAAPADLEVSR